MLSAEENGAVSIDAPISCADFTVRIEAHRIAAPTLRAGQATTELRQVKVPEQLAAGTFWHDAGAGQLIACFDLPKGLSELRY
jgi:hypothetical protein